MANYTKRTIAPRPSTSSTKPTLLKQRPVQRPIKQAVRGVKTGGYIINETTGQRRRNTK